MLFAPNYASFAVSPFFRERHRCSSSHVIRPQVPCLLCPQHPVSFLQTFLTSVCSSPIPLLLSELGYFSSCGWADSVFVLSPFSPVQDQIIF